jgi:predicted dehydrogenase
VDNQPDNGRAMQVSFPRAELFQDLEAALDRGDSDVTLVLSPMHLHASHAILALRHHNHVLCEKPMATTQAECDAMVAAARLTGRVLTVGMIRRFFPSFIKFKALLEAQVTGPVESFTYREGNRFEWDVKTPAAFRRRSEGGTGVLFDIGPHAIDYLTTLFGTPLITSYADDALDGVDVNAEMEIEFPTCSGRVQLSWDFPLRNELRVIGARGEAVLRLDRPDKLAVKSAARFEDVVADCRFAADLERPCRRTVSPGLYGQAMYCQLIQLLRAVNLGERPAVSGEEGRRCVAALDQALACARPLDMSWLSADQLQAFHNLHWSNA